MSCAEIVVPLRLWCDVFGSGTLHQAMCDDKAALLLLSFDVQQRINASLLYFHILQCATEMQCQSTVHNGQL